MAQLRKEDVRRAGSVWSVTIHPEAGTVKTDEAREVPLHRHLIDLGFIDFVQKAPPGHLFMRVTKGSTVRGVLRGLKNRITEFVREYVTDKNVAPNHGWRHRFKTVGRESGIDERILAAIQGQAASNEGEKYVDVSLKTMVTAIAKVPRYKV